MGMARRARWAGVPAFSMRPPLLPLLLPAGQRHIDLSYWAFEQLAHPYYGKCQI